MKLIEMKEVSIESLGGLGKFQEPTAYVIQGKGLTSLKGCPHTIHSDLNVANNKLSSFEGAPKKLNALVITNNLFTSLKDIHLHIHECHEIYLDTRQIKSHVLGLIMITNLFSMSEGEHGGVTEAPWTRILKKYMDISREESKKELLYQCQEELIKADMEPYAHL